MSQIVLPVVERDLDSGDRVRIHQGQRHISGLVGREGTIVEIFRVPVGSCLVLIDGDLDRREWFFYRDEVALTRT